MAARHLITGKSGEEAAVRYLRGKGYKVLDTNWRHGGLEIDIICLHKDTVVFVEVKTRSQGGLGQPADGLDKKNKAA
jgi:putative endonuclease